MRNQCDSQCTKSRISNLRLPTIAPSTMCTRQDAASRYFKWNYSFWSLRFFLADIWHRVNTFNVTLDKITLIFLVFSVMLDSISTDTQIVLSMSTKWWACLGCGMFVIHHSPDSDSSYISCRLGSNKGYPHALEDGNFYDVASYQQHRMVLSMLGHLGRRTVR